MSRMVPSLVPLGAHAVLITKGTTPKTIGQGYTAQGIPFLRAENIRDLNVDWSSSTHHIDTTTDGYLARSRIQRGDVLISIAGTIGRVGVVPDTAPPMNCNQAVAIVRPSSTLLPRYLAYWLSSHQAQSQIAKAQVSATIPNLSLSQIASLQLPLFPVFDQSRIVILLDKADAIRRKRKEALALTEELLRATFLEMFGAQLANLETGSLPVGWTRRTVDQIKADGEYTCVGGPFGSNLTSRDYVEDGVPVIRGTNLGGKTNTFIDDDFVFVSEDKAKQLLQNMAYPGDLVFTQRGTLGQVALIPLNARHPRYVVSQSQMKLTPNTNIAVPIYLHQLFCTDRLQSYIASRALTTGVPHINLSILRDTPVILPPKSEQERFSLITLRANKLQDSQRTALGESEALFASLLDRAFRGELTAPHSPPRQPSLL